MQENSKSLVISINAKFNKKDKDFVTNVYKIYNINFFTLVKNVRAQACLDKIKTSASWSKVIKPLIKAGFRATHSVISLGIYV